MIEQTVIHIGEPKHGIWRVHDNGMVREYRKAGRIGLREGVDPNSDKLTDDQLDIIRNNYGHIISEERQPGYHHEYDKLKFGYQNYIDLTIYHPKYALRFETV